MNKKILNSKIKKMNLPLFIIDLTLFLVIIIIVVISIYLTCHPM